MARHIRKGDTVMVTAGREQDRGRTGEVLRVVTADHADDVRVVVQGINIRAKNIKPSQANPQGGMIRIEVPIHASNVSPVDKNGKPTRVRFETKENGAKIRVAVTTGEQLGPELKKAR